MAHAHHHGVFSKKARDHAQRPRNNGPLEDADGYASVTGPCGDTMAFWLKMEGDVVRRVTFVTDGCGSSHACGSAATCMAEGRRIGDVAAIEQRDILGYLEGLPEESRHCALLAADTLKAACADVARKVGGNGHPSGCGEHGAPQVTTDEDRRDEEQRRIRTRVSRIRSKIMVISGKGGVGKSTVAVNLAVALRQAGNRVGLLDVDIHGPSIPTMLGLQGHTALPGRDGIQPADVEGLKVLSIGFFLNNPDDAVIWRGPMKGKVIGQFLSDVDWGDLDFLIVDSPPGTGDEPLSVTQLIGHLDGAVIVTTPQKVAEVDVRKTVTFCRKLRVPVLGIVENMSGFVCPRCGEVTPILRSGAGNRIAADMQVPFLGAIPIDPDIAASGDEGQAYVQALGESKTASIMRRITAQIENTGGTMTQQKTQTAHDGSERIAIPLEDGKLALHFGHCRRFALLDVDRESQRVIRREDIDAPPHEPGLLPKWLAERGVNTVLAGGMGQRALSLFTQKGLDVVVGVPAQPPEHLAAAYLAGTLEAGRNVCDH